MSLGIPVTELVPHSGAMVLLDEILAVDEQGMTAQLRVRADGLFDSDGRVPALVAIEYMAQTIAAWAGYHARAQAQPVLPGLLLGTRAFESSAPFFRVGERLEVGVVKVMQSAAGLAVFDCMVGNDNLNVSARLTVLTVETLEDLPSF